MSQNLSAIEKQNKQRIHQYWQQHCKQVLEDNNNSLTQFERISQDIVWIPATSSYKIVNQGSEQVNFVIPVQSIDCVYTNSMAAVFQSQQQSSPSTSTIKENKSRLQYLCSIQQTLQKSGQLSEILPRSPQQQYSLEVSLNFPQSQSKIQSNNKFNVNEAEKTNDQNHLIENNKDDVKIKQDGEIRVLIREAESYSEKTIEKEACVSNSNDNLVGERCIDYEIGKKAYRNLDDADLVHHLANNNTNSDSYKQKLKQENFIALDMKRNTPPLTIRYLSPQKHSGNNYKMEQMLTLNTIENPSSNLSQGRNVITGSQLISIQPKNSSALKTNYTIDKSAQDYSFGLRQSYHSICTIDMILPKNVANRRKNASQQLKQQNYVKYGNRMINSNLTTAREVNNQKILTTFEQGKCRKKNKKIQVTCHEDIELKAQRQKRFEKLTQEYECELNKRKKQWDLIDRPVNSTKKQAYYRQKTSFIHENQQQTSNQCCWNFCFADSETKQARNSKSQGIRLSMKNIDKSVKGVSLAPKQSRKYSIQL